MRELVVGLILIFLLVNSIIFVIAIQNNSEENNSQCNSEQDCINIGKCDVGLECTCRANKCYPGYVAECDINDDCNSGKKCKNNKCIQAETKNFTKEQIKEMIQEKNRIKFEKKTGQNCTEDCICTGVVMKCELEDGARQMTVYAQSGNIIIITKEINASTKVELYKINGTLWGKFRDNETKQIKMTPEQVQEKIKEKIKAKMEKFNITLDENGFYVIQMHKKSKLFFLFPVREKTEAQIDVENGEIVKIRTPWWGFLSKDEKSEQVLGTSCGIVTPGSNDECCENKGYDYWNSEKQECGFG